MKSDTSFKSWKRGAIGVAVVMGAGALTIGWETVSHGKILNRECG